MGSETALKLPVIDFSNPELNCGTPEWISVRSQVFKALEIYGCFEAIFDKIEEDIPEAVFGSAKEFFELPRETKLNAVEELPVHGLAGQPPVEGLGIQYADNYANVDYYTKRIWSGGNPNFTKSIQMFVVQLSELDRTVRKMIVESLGVEEYMDEHMNSVYYQFRLNRYTPPAVFPTHKDPSIISIVRQANHIDGLELEDKQGEWIKYTPSSPHSYIVLAGNALHAWSNGRVHCPPHKVSTIEGDKERYSFVLFGYPKRGFIIKAPAKLVDENHPLLFKPYDHYEFMHYVHTDVANREKKRTLEAYCGM